MSAASIVAAAVPAGSAGSRRPEQDRGRCRPGGLPGGRLARLDGEHLPANELTDAQKRRLMAAIDELKELTTTAAAPAA